jgi:hypothetical protein
MFWRKGVRTSQRWAAGVGAGGGQPGAARGQGAREQSSSPASFESPMGARLVATQDGGGSPSEE